MNQLLGSLVFLLNFILFTMATEENYDQPGQIADIDDMTNMDIIDLPSTTSLFSMSTTSSNDKDKLKEGVKCVFDFIKHHYLYVAIGAGIVLLSCIACCCCCRRRHKKKQEQNIQYSYYTQV